jgi:hypothetical protein
MASEEKPGNPPLLTSILGDGQQKQAVEGGSLEPPSIEMDICDKERPLPQLSNGFTSKFWTLVTWSPRRCRWDPEDPPKFGLGLNLLFAFVSCFSLA